MVLTVTNTERLSGLNLLISDNLQTADGSALTPAFRFYNDNQTGLFRPNNSELAVSCGGVQSLLITSSGITAGSISVNQALTAPEVNSSLIKIGDGSVSSPAIQFSADNDCGIYRVSSNTLGLSCNGQQIVELNDVEGFISRKKAKFESTLEVVGDSSLGNVSASGSLSAASGSFSGNVSAAEGNFSSSISASSGSFSGNVSAVDANLSGNLSAVDISASGTLSAGSLNVSTFGLGAGSVSSPALQIRNDDSGLYSGSDKQLSVSCHKKERLRFTDKSIAFFDVLGSSKQMKQIVKGETGLDASSYLPEVTIKWKPNWFYAKCYMLVNSPENSGRSLYSGEWSIIGGNTSGAAGDSDPTSFTWTVAPALGQGIQFTSLSQALADANVLDGHTIQIKNGSYALSATIEINKQVGIYGESKSGVIFESAGTSSDPVSMINVSVDNVKIVNCTFKHKKSSNISIETAINVSGPGSPQTRVNAFMLKNCRIEHIEFGLVIRGSNWQIKNNDFVYKGPNNSTRRHIGIYGVYGNCFALSNTSNEDIAVGVTGNTRFFNLTSTTGTNPNETNEGKLILEGNTQAGGTLQQFYNQDNWQGSANSFELYVKDNVCNETSAFVAFFGASANFANILNQVVAVGNSLSNLHTSGTNVGGKGMLACDGMGSVSFRSSALPVYHSGNVLSNLAFRPDYVEASGSSGSLAGKSSGLSSASVQLDSSNQVQFPSLESLPVGTMETVIASKDSYGFESISFPNAQSLYIKGKAGGLVPPLSAAQQYIVCVDTLMGEVERITCNGNVSSFI
jgi:hypothetical protein